MGQLLDKLVMSNVRLMIVEFLPELPAFIPPDQRPTRSTHFLLFRFRLTGDRIVVTC